MKKHKGAYRGFYKGIKCDSRWELAFLIYCLDHKIPIKRCTEYFIFKVKGKEHRYYPDFIVEGKYIEIKGYFRANLKCKLNAVINKGFKIKLIQEKQIQKYLNYCFKKYKTESLEKLYRKRKTT